ncbi:hypothetical protein CEXT_725421 [Caerostris extrusa]|uniref:Uncharacterized protein n=1 Tax=Caerostris extrusa TaxID=172846 RepID=A0AAV4XQ40_CAEEX|nr:hypothetical protein CEXT_725421 [Caerostris extrusa]
MRNSIEITLVTPTSQSIQTVLLRSLFHATNTALQHETLVSNSRLWKDPFSWRIPFDRPSNQSENPSLFKRRNSIEISLVTPISQRIQTVLLSSLFHVTNTTLQHQSLVSNSRLWKDPFGWRD